MIKAKPHRDSASDVKSDLTEIMYPSGVALIFKKG